MLMIPDQSPVYIPLQASQMCEKTARNGLGSCNYVVRNLPDHHTGELAILGRRVIQYPEAASIINPVLHEPTE